MILAGSGLALAFRLLFAWVLFLSAQQVQDVWLVWALMIIISIIVTRGLYRAYRIMSLVSAASKID
jgi:hypothetical protein